MVTGRTSALTVVAALAVSAIPGSPFRATTDGDGDHARTLTVRQSRATGDALVTVQRNGIPVTDATVTVDGYAGSDTYETDETGTVRLPAPRDPVSVEVDVEIDDVDVGTTARLVPYEDSLTVEATRDSRDLTVTVTQYGDAVSNATVTVSGPGAGDASTYETGDDGTVTIPRPDDQGSILIHAAYDNLTAETTERLRSDDGENDPT